MKIKYLIALLFLVFVLASCSNSTQNGIIEETSDNLNNQKQLNNVSLSEFKEELNKKDSIIIDLRTTKELEETGIISGAKQIDFYASDFKSKLEKLDKNEKYLIYCRSGGRSGQTLSMMKKLGFMNVFEMRGGMNAWLGSGEETIPFMQDMNNNMMMNSDKNAMMNNNVTLNAKNWEFDKKIIKAKKGEKLIININNIDGSHGIAIPDMRIIGDEQIEVDTSKAGEYEFRCANYCGEGHSDMIGKIIIE